MSNPLRYIFLGTVLLLLGVLLPFLMVLRILEPTFFLSLLSYAASLIGLILGLFGIFQYSGRGRG